MVLGVAGGVGSGKSTVLTMLGEMFDAKICMADELGHEALKPGSPTAQSVIREFGEEIVGASGEIDRDRLAAVIYGEDEKRERLNGIVHPYVKDRIQELIGACPKNKLFVLESAILFETGCDECCQEVIGVLTKDEIRIRRLMESRGYSRQRAIAIMSKQIGNAALEEKCSDVIHNDGDVSELEGEIRRCMENILEKQV